MAQFIPFADDSQSLTVGEFTLENQGEQVNLYGSLTLTIDQKSLKQAKQLHNILAQAIAYLEKNHADTIEKSAIVADQQAKVEEITNPFA